MTVNNTTDNYKDYDEVVRTSLLAFQQGRIPDALDCIYELYLEMTTRIEPISINEDLDQARLEKLASSEKCPQAPLASKSYKTDIDNLQKLLDNSLKILQRHGRRGKSAGEIWLPVLNQIIIPFLKEYESTYPNRRQFIKLTICLAPLVKRSAEALKISNLWNRYRK